MSSNRQGRSSEWPFFFLVLVWVGLLYCNHFDNGFHFDDSHTIVDNPAIRDLANWPRLLSDATAFSVLPSNQGWRPLVTLSLAVDYRLGGGLKPWAFHADTFGVFLVLLTGFFLLARRVLGSPRKALVAVALLGVHPVLAETVNYAIQRGDLYATLGWVWGLWLFSLRGHSRVSRAWPVPFGLACLCKPTALIFPLLLLAWMVCLQGRVEWKPLLLALALALGMAGLHRHFTPPSFRTGGPALLPYWWTQPAILCFYVLSLLAPIHLVADTDWSCFARPTAAPALAGDLGLLLLWVLGVWATRRRSTQGPTAFGLAWFGLGVCLTSLVPLAEVTNDHRMCLAYPGLILAWVHGLGQIRGRWLALPLVAWLLWLSGLTWQRNRVWHSEESLWRDVTQKSPASGRGWMNYALTQMKVARMSEAQRAFEKAVQLAPNYPLAHLNLAICLAAQGHGEAAEAEFSRAESLDPKGPEVPYYRARWQNRPDRRELLLRSLQRRPQYANAWNLLCQIDLQGKDWPALQSDLEWAQSRPDYQRAAAELARQAEQAQGQERLESQRELERTHSLEAYLNHSYVLWKQNRMEQSLEISQQGLQRFPREARLHNNRAAALIGMQRWAEAAQSAREALRLKPDFRLARNNLQQALSHRP